MTGAEFYEKHNIGRSTFARICATGTDTLDKYWNGDKMICATGTDTLDKYWNGDKMRGRTRSKIDYAVRYFEDNNIDWGRLTGMDQFIRPWYVDEVYSKRRRIVDELHLGGTI